MIEASTTPELSAMLDRALAGRYRVERPLGEGGASLVYLAEDQRHRRKVAIKVLRPDLAAAVGAQRFLREIEIAARLAHPNILPLHDSGEAGPFLYYVMPYVEGETLRHRLLRDKRIPLDEALRIGREVGRGLAYAHAEGVVHRDIKPENILLAHGIAVIADFGVARALDVAVERNVSVAGHAIGTPAYMSPEQASGEGPVDGRSDQYALGCVLFEMLTGTPPHWGDSLQGLLARRLFAPPPRLRTLMPELPASVDAVVARAMAIEPEDRFASTAEMVAALRPGLTAINAPATERSVAVLPFASLSGDRNDEYFADGVTEDIITQLSHIGGLKVISRTSVMPYKGVAKPVPEIARDLGVTHVLEGSVRRAGQRVRIVAQLIEAQSDGHVWAETYDRDLTDVFAIQSDVAQAIARTLETRLTVGDRRRLARAPTANLDAYQLALVGRQIWNRQSSFDEWAEAARYLERAVMADPAYALAWAYLAEVRLNIANLVAPQPVEAYPAALEAARMAVESDPTLAEGHAVLGTALYQFEYDWSGAERALETAARLGPGSALVHNHLGKLRTALGQHDEAIAAHQRAVELAPADLMMGYDLALALYHARRYAESGEWFARLRVHDPKHPQQIVGALPLVMLGRIEEAEDVACVPCGATDFYPMITAAYVHARAGRPAAARDVLRSLRVDGPEFPFGHAVVHLANGDFARALDYLERGYRTRSAWMYWIGVEPGLDPLREEPRFRALLDRMGLVTAGV